MRGAAARTTALNERFLAPLQRRIARRAGAGNRAGVAPARPCRRADRAPDLAPPIADDERARSRPRCRRACNGRCRKSGRLVRRLVPAASRGDLTIGETVGTCRRGHRRRAGCGAGGRSCAICRRRRPLATKIALYRIVQEALANASAACRERRVAPGGRGRIRPAADRGVGRRPGIRRAAIGDGGERLGLLGMRERVESLGGEFAVEWAPGPGRGSWPPCRWRRSDMVDPLHVAIVDDHRSFGKASPTRCGAHPDVEIVGEGASRRPTRSGSRPTPARRDAARHVDAGRRGDRGAADRGCMPGDQDRDADRLGRRRRRGGGPEGRALSATSSRAWLDGSWSTSCARWPRARSTSPRAWPPAAARAERGAATGADRSGLLDDLTARERQVLEQVAGGLTATRRSGDGLGLSREDGQARHDEYPRKSCTSAAASKRRSWRAPPMARGAPADLGKSRQSGSR